MKSAAAAKAACIILLLPSACGDQPLRVDAAYRVVPEWPAANVQAQLGHVSGLALGLNGELWLFHRAERSGLPFNLNTPITSSAVLRVNAKTGALHDSWGANQFVAPHGLTVDAQGNLWLTDIALHQVFKFAPDGRMLLTLGRRGVAGNTQDLFNGPSDVAIASDGSFFVADGYGNNRIVKFDVNGRFLLQWGSRGTAAGQFDLPHGVALAETGALYVADRGNARVQVFDASGNHLRTLAGAELGRPWAVALQHDQLFVVDGSDPVESGANRARVVRADRVTGAARESFGSFGTAPGQFNWPHDIAVAADGTVFVAEILNRRVQKFRR